MSLGPSSRYTDSAVDNAAIAVASMGIKVAIAAGNSADDANFYSPARASHPNIYTVSASDINDNFASFSNFGSVVDFAARSWVKSTYLEVCNIKWYFYASPHVCGLLLTNVSSDGFVNGGWKSRSNCAQIILRAPSESFFFYKSLRIIQLVSRNLYFCVLITKPMNALSELSAISPIDGRYRSKTEQLAPYFSEEGLIKYRVLVEIEYFVALCEIPLPQLAEFDSSKFESLRAIYKNFSAKDAQAIKDIEKVTNHDVKAVEYFIKEKFDGLNLGKNLSILD